MNKVIQYARDVALDILKPSQRDIDHGMELHRNSIVCESYGLGLRAAVDGDAIRAATEAGASNLEIQDMIEDMSMTRCITDPQEQQEYKAAWEASGVTCILQNAGEEGNSPLRLIKRLARYTYVTDMMPGFLLRAITPDEFLRCSWRDELGKLREYGARFKNLGNRYVNDGAAEAARFVADMLG